MKRKNFFLLLISIAVLLCFTACNAADKTPKNDDKTSANAQIRLIAENADVWDKFIDYPVESFRVAVTDMDNNGRLEVICAATMGSGISTSSAWAEVSSDFESLVNIQNNMSQKNSEPEIIVKSTDCFVNPDTGERIYSFVDTARASGDYITYVKGLLTLKDDAVSFKALGTCISVAENPEDITNRTFTYSDADGNSLTQEEFDSYINEYLEGFDKLNATFKWQEYSKTNALSQDEIEKLLTESYEGFSVK